MRLHTLAINLARQVFNPRFLLFMLAVGLNSLLSTQVKTPAKCRFKRS